MKEISKKYNQKADKHKINEIIDKYYMLFIIMGLFLTNLLIWILCILYIIFKFNIFILLSIDLSLLFLYGIYVVIIDNLGTIEYCYKCGFCKRCHKKQLWYLHELNRFSNLRKKV